MHVDHHTHTVKVRNEDIYGITRYGAFVIDGASALTKNHFTPDGHDIHWMVTWWRGYLEEHLDHRERSLQEILKKGVERYNEAFSAFADHRELTKQEHLSASIGITRLNGDYLEVYVLGDAEVSLVTADGGCETITDQAIKAFDERVIEMMRQNPRREEELIFKGFTADEWEVLLAHRGQMNTPEGYFILAHSVEAIDHGIYREIPVDRVQGCLLATDGIVPLDHLYKRKELIERVEGQGVAQIVNELRAFEEQDLEKRQVARLKTHDDVTLVYIKTFDPSAERGDAR